MKVALIVEGFGDVQAMPTLAARTGAILGTQIHAHNPIRAGCVTAVAREGELERFLKMAASRDGLEAILVVLDLDDGCPGEMAASFIARYEAIKDEIVTPVRFCFCVREFEAWFLDNLEVLKAGAPEYDWDAEFVCADGSAKRDAKGLINSAMAKHYKEPIDQLKLTKKLELKALYQRSKSYRKFVKSLTGMDYELLETCFAVA